MIRTAILAGFTATLLGGDVAVLDGRLEVGPCPVLVFVTPRPLWPLTHLRGVLDLHQRALAPPVQIGSLRAVEPTMHPGTRPLPTPVAGDLPLERVRPWAARRG